MLRGPTVTTLKEPLVFETYLRPQIWGGQGLGLHLGKSIPLKDASFGEAWEVSGLADHPSYVAEGEFRGASLVDLWAQYSADIIGAEDTPAEFPLLIKWLDCRELFSVQVHPDDSMARAVLGQPHGKSEAWVIVHADATSRAYAGLKPDVTPSEFESHLDSGTVTECLHSFEPRVGDCIWLPAGTVHAIGGGVILAEIQQPSDATFRLFDWNRLDSLGQPRPLHRELALEALDWKQGPVSPAVPVPLDIDGKDVRGESLLRSPFFELERFTLERSWSQPHRAEMTIWMVLEGDAELLSPGTGSVRKLSRGATVLIPATAGETIWAPTPSDASCRLLCVRLPSR
jgi:mannose-6-phosphate isomerase